MMLDLAIVVGIAGLGGLVVATVISVLAQRRERQRVYRLAHRDHSGWDAQGQPWPYYEGNEAEDSAELPLNPSAEQRRWDTWFNEGGRPGAWYGPNDPRNSQDPA